MLLIAGAGYGKTTALRQALGQTDSNAAWVRCADARGDAGRLLTLLLDAVRRAAPGAADALAERLASVRAPIDAALAAAALERELACVLVEPLVVVFDDAETLTGGRRPATRSRTSSAANGRGLRGRSGSRSSTARSASTGRSRHSRPPGRAERPSPASPAIRCRASDGRHCSDR